MNRESNDVWAVIAIAVLFLSIVVSLVIMLALNNVPGFTESITPFMWIVFGVNTLARVFALVYLFLGYGKENAIWYKLFVVTFAISLLLAVTLAVDLAAFRPLIARALLADAVLMYGNIMVLAIAKNLGKKISMSLAWCTFLLPVIFIIVVLIIHPGYLRGGKIVDTIVALTIFRFVAPAFALLVATNSKYVDKAARGREV